MENVSGTDRIITFLRQNMLSKFCTQWPQFSRLVDKFGEDEILSNYAEQLLGKGYKTSQINLAIKRCIETELNYPKPYAFSKLIKSPNLDKDPFEHKKLTKQERENVTNILREVKNNNKALNMHKELGTDFGNRPGSTTIQVKNQIELVAEKLLGRPLKK